MTKDELYCQSLTDLLRAAVVLSEILETKPLTRCDEQRIAYGVKLVEEVIKRQRKLTKQ